MLMSPKIRHFFFIELFPVAGALSWKKKKKKIEIDKRYNICGNKDKKTKIFKNVLRLRATKTKCSLDLLICRKKSLKILKATQNTTQKMF